MRLYADFMTNAASFDATVQFWDDITNELARKLGQEGDWKPWVARFFADGKTPIDTPGNPIYDVRSQTLDRAFQIIQHPPGDDPDGSVAAWVKAYDEEHGYDMEVFPVAELFVSIVLTDRTAEMAKMLLETWMTPATTPEVMQKTIAEQLPDQD